MSTNGVFEPRGLRRLLGIAVPSFLLMLTLAVVGAGVAGVVRHGANSFSTSGVGHAALVALLESLNIPVVRSQSQSGTRARKGLLVVLDAREDAQDAPIDTVRLMKMAGRARTTLLVLPKWQVGVALDRDDWARPHKASVWRGEALLEDLGLDDLDVRSIATPLDAGPWRTQNFGPAPNLGKPHLIVGDGLDPIVAHQRGMLVGETRLAGRRLVVVSDPDVLNTRGLADDHNAILVARLIDHLRGGGPVVIDEVLHGYGGTPSFWRTMFRPPLLNVTLAAALCALLLGWAAWRRFGPAQPAAAVRPKGLRERVDEAARLLGSGRTSGVVLAGYLDHVKRSVDQQMAGGGVGDRTVALDRMSAARGASETWSTLSTAVRMATKDRTPSIPEAVQLARRARQWRQEMTHDAR